MKKSDEGVYCAMLMIELEERCDLIWMVAIYYANVENE